MEGRQLGPAGSEGRTGSEAGAGGAWMVGGAWAGLTEGAGRAAGLTCRILQRSDRQSMSSQGWYMPRVTQFSRITSMLIHSNHVRTKSRTQQLGGTLPPPTQVSTPLPARCLSGGTVPMFSKTF